MLDIRAAEPRDADAIWGILEPTIRAGETYTLPPDGSREEMLAYWFAAGHRVFVAEDDGEMVGTYYLRANQGGGGAHVANCGYMTAGYASGAGCCSRNVRALKRRSPARRLPSYAIQFRRRYERAGGEAVAQSGIPDGWRAAFGVCSSAFGVRGCLRDVCGAVVAGNPRERMMKLDRESR